MILFPLSKKGVVTEKDCEHCNKKTDWILENLDMDFPRGIVKAYSHCQECAKHERNTQSCIVFNLLPQLQFAEPLLVPTA